MFSFLSSLFEDDQSSTVNRLSQIEEYLQRLAISLKETYQIVYDSLEVMDEYDISNIAFKGDWKRLEDKLNSLLFAREEDIKKLREKTSKNEEEARRLENLIIVKKELCNLKDIFSSWVLVVELLQLLQEFPAPNKNDIFSFLCQVARQSQKTKSEYDESLQQRNQLLEDKGLLQNQIDDSLSENLKKFKAFFKELFQLQAQLFRIFNMLMVEYDHENFNAKKGAHQIIFESIKEQFSKKYKEIFFELEKKVQEMLEEPMSNFFLKGVEFLNNDLSFAVIFSEVNEILEATVNHVENARFFNLWGKLEESLMDSVRRDDKTLERIKENFPFTNVREWMKLLSFFEEVQKKGIVFDKEAICQGVMEVARQQAWEELKTQLDVENMTSLYNGFDVSHCSITWQEFEANIKARGDDAKILEKEKELKAGKISTTSVVASSNTLGRSYSASSSSITASLNGLSSPSKLTQAKQNRVFSPEGGKNFRNGSSPQLHRQNSNLPAGAGTFGEMLEKLEQDGQHQSVPSLPAAGGNGSLLTTSSPSPFSSPARGADKTSGSSVSGMTPLSSNPGLSPTNQRHAPNGGSFPAGRQYSNGSPSITRTSAPTSQAPSPDERGIVSAFFDKLTSLKPLKQSAQGHQQPPASPTRLLMQKKRGEG